MGKLKVGAVAVQQVSIISILRCTPSRRRRTFTSSRHSFILATYQGELENTHITTIHFITLNRDYKSKL